MDRLLVDASVIGPAAEKGAQRYARELVEELGRQGDLDLRILVREGARPFSEHNISNVATIPMRRRNLWLMRGLNQYAKRGGFSTVLVAGEGPAVLDSSRRMFIAAHEVPRRLLTSRGMDRPISTESAIDRLTGRALRSSIRVFALSSFMAGCLTTHYRLDPDSVTVVPPGISQLFLNDVPAKADGEQFALVFATGDTREDPAVAIRALGLARTAIRRVVLVGSHSDLVLARHLEEVAFRWLKVQSLGRVEDSTLRDLYSSAGCYIETSSYEGYGLQVAEALSQGCPVFLRRIPVFQELRLERAHYWDGSAESLAERLVWFEKMHLFQKEKSRVLLQTWANAASEIRRTVFTTPERLP